MDIFTLKKLLVRLVVLLICINIASISIFLWKSGKINSHLQSVGEKYSTSPVPEQDSEGYRNVTGILIKELQLSVEQARLMQEIRASFYEKEHNLGKTLRGQRDSMNIQMFNKQTNEEQLKKLARSVADNEYDMELLRIQQAQQLKAICTPQQQEKFEKLVIEIRDYFRPDNRPKGLRPGRR